MRSLLNRSTCTFTTACRQLTIKRTMDGCRQADQKTRENITTTEDDDEFFDDIFLSDTVCSIAAIETRLSDLLRSLPADRLVPTSTSAGKIE